MDNTNKSRPTDDDCYNLLLQVSNKIGNIEQRVENVSSNLNNLKSDMDKRFDVLQQTLNRFDERIEANRSAISTNKSNVALITAKEAAIEQIQQKQTVNRRWIFGAVLSVIGVCITLVFKFF